MFSQNDSSLYSGYFSVIGYNVTKLVFDFSNLTRYDTNFSPVKNASIMDLQDYAEYMLMYALFGAVTAFAVIVAISVLCCTQMMLNNRRQKPMFNQFSKITLLKWFCVISISIAASASFSMSFVANHRTNVGLDGVCINQHKIVELLHAGNESTCN